MLRSTLILALVICCFSCNTTTYFIVRHAEKAENTMSTDVPLSQAGQQRAIALKDMLQHKKIGTIYSTDYLRTRSTAQPLAETIGLTIQVYDPGDTTFIHRIINTGNQDKEGNMLIVGHSNTVDDLVNKMVGQKVVNGDLPDSQYGDLFIVKQKGKKFTFQQKRFGP